MPVGPSVNPMWLGSVSTASPTQEDIAKGCCRHPAGEAQDGGQDQEREAVPSAVERPSVTLDPQGENPEKRNRTGRTRTKSQGERKRQRGNADRLQRRSLVRVKRTHYVCKPTWNSSIRRPSALLRALWAPACTNIHIHRIRIKIDSFKRLGRKLQREAGTDEPSSQRPSRTVSTQNPSTGGNCVHVSGSQSETASCGKVDFQWAARTPTARAGPACCHPKRPQWLYTRTLKVDELSGPQKSPAAAPFCYMGSPRPASTGQGGWS